MFIRLIARYMRSRQEMFEVLLQSEWHRTAKVQHVQDWLISISGTEEYDTTVIII